LTEKIKENKNGNILADIRGRPPGTWDRRVFTG